MARRRRHDRRDGRFRPAYPARATRPDDPRVDDSSAALDSARRPAGARPACVLAGEHARSRALPLPHGRGDRVPAQSARPRAPEGPGTARPRGRDRLRDPSRRRSWSSSSLAHRRRRPDAASCRADRHLRYGGARTERADRRRAGSSTGWKRGSPTEGYRWRCASRAASGLTRSRGDISATTDADLARARRRLPS